MKRAPSKAAPQTGKTPSTFETPWDTLDDDGASLDVFHFPTTLMTLVGNVMRRTITLPYVEAFGLTFAEWRILSVLGHTNTLTFAELEVLAATDKSLVSRTLRLLEKRGLVSIQDQGNKDKKKLTSSITSAGLDLYDKTIVAARQSQVDALALLSVDERRTLYKVLQTWHTHYAGGPAPAPVP